MNIENSIINFTNCTFAFNSAILVQLTSHINFDRKKFLKDGAVAHIYEFNTYITFENSSFTNNNAMMVKNKFIFLLIYLYLLFSFFLRMEELLFAQL